MAKVRSNSNATSYNSKSPALISPSFANTVATNALSNIPALLSRQTAIRSGDTARLWSFNLKYPWKWLTASSVLASLFISAASSAARFEWELRL